CPGKPGPAGKGRTARDRPDAGSVTSRPPPLRLRRKECVRPVPPRPTSAPPLHGWHGPRGTPARAAGGTGSGRLFAVRCGGISGSTGGVGRRGGFVPLWHT